MQLAGGIGLLRQGVQDARTDARALPPLAAAGDGAPGTIALRQVPPRSPGAQAPSEAMEKQAMVTGGSAGVRFLGWEQGLEPLPWLIRQLASAYHTDQDTRGHRVCTHALGRRQAFEPERLLDAQ